MKLKIKIIDRVLKSRQGVSLLELTVAVFLFVLTFVLVTGIFQSVVIAQYDTIADQEVQENIRYTFEKMSKELRTAQKDKNYSCIPSGNIYWTNANKTAIQFLDYHGHCVCYYLNGSDLMTSRGGCDNGTQSAKTPQLMMPQKVKASRLYFKVTDSGPVKQAFLTFKIRIETVVKGLRSKKIDLQTSLSSRFYE